MSAVSKARVRVGLGTILVSVAAFAVAGVGLASWQSARQTERSALAASKLQRQREADRIRLQVENLLGVARSSIGRLAQAVTSDAVPSDASKFTSALEASLFVELSSNPLLEEVTFTRAKLLGYDADGQPLIGDRCSELSLYRVSSTGVQSRWTKRDSPDNGAQYVARERALATARYAAGDFGAPVIAEDPAQDPRFSVSASQDYFGQELWSDLHYSDKGRREVNPVILTLQRSVPLPDSEVGVLRVAIATESLDQIAQAWGKGRDGNALFHSALLAVSENDAEPARLVARVTPQDQVVEMEDELRFESRTAPPEIGALLGSELLHGLDLRNPDRDGVLNIDGVRYLATLRHLELGSGGTAGWCVAIVVPEANYTAELRALSQNLGAINLLTFGAVLGVAAAFAWSLRRGLALATLSTRRMQQFDFATSHNTSRIREVDAVLDGLERAKAVARAMEKYVPLALIRGFYESKREPELGGAEVEVTVLFSDLVGFTSLTEDLPVSKLARALGAYFEAMTGVIEGHAGMVDKFIGDAVMALWNVPEPVADPALRACSALLECKAQLEQLYASPAWSGLPRLGTRFGLHTGTMLAGHFGAPRRLNYTVLGDGVNLAARLESLCKVYGVDVLVSETVERAAVAQFAFRRVDRVTVKGKSQSVLIYQLLGKQGALGSKYAIYEAALSAYFERQFESALAKLAEGYSTGTLQDDGPSRLLQARCEAYLREPPPPDWDGSFVLTVK